MPIQLKCAKCNKLLNIRDEFAGKLGKCPFCKNVMRIPGKAVARPAPAAPARPAGAVPAAARPAAAARPVAAPRRPAAPAQEEIVLPPEPGEMAETVILYDGVPAAPAAAPAQPRPSAFGPAPGAGGYVQQPVPAMVAQPAVVVRKRKKGPSALLIIPVILAFAAIGVVAYWTISGTGPIKALHKFTPAKAQEAGKGQTSTTQPTPETPAPSTTAQAPATPEATTPAAPAAGTTPPATGSAAPAETGAPALPTLPGLPPPAATPSAQPAAAATTPAAPPVPAIPAAPAATPAVPALPPSVPAIPSAGAGAPAAPTTQTPPAIPSVAAPTAPAASSTAPSGAPLSLAKLKAIVVSAEKTERVFIKHKRIKPEQGAGFIQVTLELEASEFKEMTFGAETKKACIVDLTSMVVTAGNRQIKLYANGKDEDTLSTEQNKLMYIYDTEPKMKWCYVFPLPQDATGLKIQSSQFEALPLTVKQ